MDEDFEDDDYDPDPDACCTACQGDGYVESVLDVTGRWGWDEDEPGRCPYCHGTGKQKDRTVF